MPTWVEKIAIDLLMKYITPIITKWIQDNLTADKLGDVIKAVGEQVVCWAKVQAADTSSKIDDQFVKVLADALGIDPNTCKVP